MSNWKSCWKMSKVFYKLEMLLTNLSKKYLYDNINQALSHEQFQEVNERTQKYSKRQKR